jgi:hypothetical protein
VRFSGVLHKETLFNTTILGVGLEERISAKQIGGYKTFGGLKHPHFPRIYWVPISAKVKF